jgi:uncharacterized membrane-anchored protein
LEKSRQKRRPLSGVARVGLKTKSLLKQLSPGQIIVICHDDLDEVAAQDIVDAKVKCIINAGHTMSGSYPTCGAAICLKHGIPIVEIARDDFLLFCDGETVTVDVNRGRVFTEKNTVRCHSFTLDDWRRLYLEAEQRLSEQFSRFIDNTIQYVSKEKNYFVRPLTFPEVLTPIQGRHVLVVARGSGYKRDLKAIRPYIEDYRPILIGIDGGADALLENGWKPDLIVGDMDSVSEQALCCGAEIIVHAYPDGHAPGFERVSALGLPARTIRAPGTSEDLALLIAYEKKAEWIVTIGTHTHMIDFLEKGRKGMASTLLVHMKIGGKIINAKGVSMLYRPRPKWKWVGSLSAAGLFPLFMLIFMHPGIRHYFKILYVYLKLLVS